MKSRSYSFEAYPDDPVCNDLLEYVKKYYDYAFILHDKDVFDSQVIDTDCNVIHEVGELKKPHYHVIISFKNPRSIDKIKNELNLKHIETCNFYMYTRYLIHLDNPRKYQYNEDDIVTNMSLRVHNALKRDYNSQEQDTRILLDFIYSNSNQSYLTLRQLTDYAIENDCLLDLKKNIHFYKLFVDDIGFRRI